MKAKSNQNFTGKRKDQGFTLLEVLVAMTIFAVVIGVLSNLFQTSLRQTDSANNILRAAELAEGQLARLGKDLPLKVGIFDGVSIDGLRWQAEISMRSPVEPDKEFALYRIEIEVVTEFGSPIPFKLTTFRIGLL